MSEISAIPPPDTSPDSALPVPKPSSQPHVPSARTLQSYLHKTDAQIAHLARILSTPAGTDKLLLTICYTTLLSSNVLSSISLARIQRAARQIIEKAIALPPNTTVIIDTAAIPTSRLLVTAQRLKALSSLISDFRIFARLWGLIRIWTWGTGVWRDPPKDVVIRRISYAQVFVNIFLQYLENHAYLASKGVLGLSPEKQNKLWAWSSRFWMAHVGLDFLRLYREYTLRKSRGSEEEKRLDGPRGDVMTDQGEREWMANWKREFLINASFAPLTAHWSFEQGLVGDFWVGLFGSVAGVTGIRHLWKVTA